MSSETRFTGLTTKQGQQHHCNKISFTEEDFKNENITNIFDEFIKEEHMIVPPADRKVFDYFPEDIRAIRYDHKSPSSQDYYLTRRPIVPIHTQTIVVPTTVFDDNDNDDAIRIPSLDENLKWSPQNPIITIPNIGHTALAHAISGGEASIGGARLSILEELKRITYDQAMKPRIPGALISEEEITGKDIICERGGKSNRHEGTKRYRGMIDRFKPQYQSLTTKTSKTNLSRKIISKIQQNGGRFLKKNDKSQKYFVLSPVETTRKVSQAMRERRVLKWTDKSTTMTKL